jgi:hypothetical protein
MEREKTQVPDENAEAPVSRIFAAVNDSILIREIEVGAVIHLRDGSAAEVVGNPRDGGWLLVKVLECPVDAARVGEEEMVFCTDVIGAR